ncbi:MAG: ribosome maturation factor RimM [Christensenellaceae bacterium]|jgi:16S rRNA processing protein RimM|nr:ribosome maturation factor RimM [Christensenellaceae bacterium]
MENKEVLIGKVLRPRGLKGELKTDATLFNLKKVLIDNKNFIVENVSKHNGFVYFKLVGVDNIDAAEKLRGKEIYAEPILQEGEILTSDLIGFTVVCGDKKIGKVKSVESYGGGNFLSIACFGGFRNIPYEDEFIVETNMTKKEIIINDAALQEDIIL